MNRQIKFICTFCALAFIGITNSLSGQGINHCYIHVDKPFYVTGEVIWYKIYFPVSIIGNDKAIGISIFNGDARVVHNSFLKTNKKTFVTGYFKIPFEAKAGVYNLVVSGTNSTTKKKEQLASAQIPIYNDLTTSEETVGVENESTSPAPPSSSPLNVQLEMSKRTYKQREQVEAAITITDNLGKPVKANVSVSVVDLGLVKTKESFAGTLFVSKPVTERQISSMDRDIRINGKVSFESEFTNSKTYMDVYSQTQNSGYHTSANEKGEFSLPLPDFYGTQDLLFRLHFILNGEWQGDSSGAYTPVDITLLEDEFTGKKKELVFTPEIVSYLENSRQRKLIYQLFNQVEAPLEFSEQNNADQEPDMFFIVSEYERFPDVPSFFKDISTPLKFRKGKKGAPVTAMMFNPDIRRFYPVRPLFIIDGQVTRNPNAAISLRFENIEDIALYFHEDNLDDQFGPMGDGGVVIINSKNKYLADLQVKNSNEVVVHGIQPPASFHGTGSLESQENENTPPEFRSQLFWDGDITTDLMGKAEIVYSQSNDIGQFKIEVVVQGENGEIGWGSCLYDVVW